MKVFKLISLLGLLFIVSTTVSAQERVDSCATFSWIVRIYPTDDLPTRDGLFKILRVLGTPGASVDNIFNLSEYSSIFFSFDASYYSGPEKAEETMLNMLTDLTSVDGIEVYCDDARGYLF